MRARADLRYETQRNARRLYFFTTRAQPLDGLFHEIDLVNRVNIDRVDARAYGIVKLVVTLASAVEDDLVGPEADSQRLEEFAAAVDFEIDSRVPDDFENRHV